TSPQAGAVNVVLLQLGSYFTETAPHGATHLRRLGTHGGTVCDALPHPSWGHLPDRIGRDGFSRSRHRVWRRRAPREKWIGSTGTIRDGPSRAGHHPHRPGKGSGQRHHSPAPTSGGPSVWEHPTRAARALVRAPRGSRPRD